MAKAYGSTARWLESGEIAWVDDDERLRVAKVETAPVFRAAAPSALFSIDQKHRMSPAAIGPDIGAGPG